MLGYDDSLGTPFYQPDSPETQGGAVDPASAATMAMQPPPGGAAESGGGLLSGKGDWKDALKHVGVGLGLGLLGHQLSGGKISFGEAMGHVGKGWADQKKKQNDIVREQSRKQYDTQIDMIHDALQQMKGVDLSKYPRLMELSQKYRDAILQGTKDGHPISPKDATELLGLWTTAQGEFGKAKDETRVSDISRDAKAKTDAEFAARRDLYMHAPPGAGQGPVTSQDAERRAYADLTSNATENEQIPITDPEIGKFMGGATSGRRKDILDASAKIAQSKWELARVRESEAAATGRERTRLQAEERQARTSLYNTAMRTFLQYSPFGQTRGTPDDAKKYAQEIVDSVMGQSMTGPPGSGSTSLPVDASKVVVIKKPGQ